MENIQLKHPQNKKAVSMDKSKYDILKTYLLMHLKSNDNCTHAELLKSVIDGFKKDKVKFVGSIEWHMEWVKLDLESRKIIKRTGKTSPIKFSITKNN
jgi:hypothetical protein